MQYSTRYSSLCINPKYRLSKVDFFILLAESRASDDVSFGGTNTSLWIEKSRLRDGTEPAVFVPEVPKQHDVFAGAIAFGVLVSARNSFWLDKKIRKLFEYFYEDFQKPALVPPTAGFIQNGNIIIAGLLLEGLLVQKRVLHEENLRQKHLRRISKNTTW